MKCMNTPKQTTECRFDTKVYQVCVCVVCMDWSASANANAIQISVAHWLGYFFACEWRTSFPELSRVQHTNSNSTR